MKTFNKNSNIFFRIMDLINDIFKITLYVQYSTSVILISVAVYNLSMINLHDILTGIKLTLHSNTFLIELLILCFSGHRIRSKVNK